MKSTINFFRLSKFATSVVFLAFVLIFWHTSLAQEAAAVAPGAAAAAAGAAAAAKAGKKAIQSFGPATIGVTAIGAAVAANEIYKNSTDKLKKNLAANGESGGKGCAAHHIVPQLDPRAHDSREILKSCGIGIHDAINGVYLKDREETECKGTANHRSIHTKRYLEGLFDLLYDAQSSGGCSEVKKEMQSIKDRLMVNKFIME